MLAPNLLDFFGHMSRTDLMQQFNKPNPRFIIVAHTSICSKPYLCFFWFWRPQTWMVFKYTWMVHANCSMVKRQYTWLIILGLLYIHNIFPLLAVTREMNGHCSTSSIILSCLTERPNSIFNGDASLTEEPRNRSSWYLQFKLQSFVCFPDVARPNWSRILPLSHHYRAAIHTIKLLGKSHAPIKKSHIKLG